MPNPGLSLAMTCPHCQHDLARLTVRSVTILTVTCGRCGYMWAVELTSMPEPERMAAEAVALERDTRH